MDGRASLPTYWAPKGPRAPSIGQPHGREPRKTNHGYRDTGMSLRTKTGGKPMYSEKVDVKDVLGLVNAARQAAGWDSLEELPKGRRGPDRCPISEALNCCVDYYKAFMDRSYIINFSAAWESPVHILNAGFFLPRCQIYSGCSSVNSTTVCLLSTLIPTVLTTKVKCRN